MGLAIFSYLRYLWPVCTPKLDDLKLSNQLVQKLSVPEHTKQFVFAVRDPETHSVIYLLAAQNLSERSAADAEHLIREVQPDAVVAQLSHSAVVQVQSGEGDLDDIHGAVPTSALGVLRRSFLDRVNREKYENVAGNMVLQEIFGISLHGHFSAAKKTAEDVGSTFLLLESPFLKQAGEFPSGEPGTVNKFQGLGTQTNSLVPHKVSNFASSGSKQFSLTNDFQYEMVKLISPYLEILASHLSSVGSGQKTEHREHQPLSGYQVPSFARFIYPLLVDLHDIFVDLPSIGKALSHSQKIFYDVSRGEQVDSEWLCEVYTFRIAVEGLRIALSNAARLPINRMASPNSVKTEFSELSVEEKSHALLAEALRSQSQKFKKMVAIVDASCMAGLRKHWNTLVPPAVKDMVGELVTDCEADLLQSKDGKKHSLTKSSVVAVGAGATAVIGVSSISKVVPASTVMKIVAFNVPSSLKLFLSQTHKVIGIAFSKIVGPSKILAPGLASSGAKTKVALNAAASANKIRAVAHSVIASAEKTSFSATRTAFYEIMRKRRVQPVGFLPWATFGCSIATCAGLFVYGDGIECAAESLPAASSIACLGRGIESLHRASEMLRQSHGSKIHKSIESLMYRSRKGKLDELV